MNRFLDQSEKIVSWHALFYCRATRVWSPKAALCGRGEYTVVKSRTGQGACQAWFIIRSALIVMG